MNHNMYVILIITLLIGFVSSWVFNSNLIEGVDVAVECPEAINKNSSIGFGKQGVTYAQSGDLKDIVDVCGCDDWVQKQGGCENDSCYSSFKTWNIGGDGVQGEHGCFAYLKTEVEDAAERSDLEKVLFSESYVGRLSPTGTPAPTPTGTPAPTPTGTPAPTPTGTPAPTPGGTDTASYDGITKSVCNTNDKDTLQTNCYCPLDVKDGVTCANPRQIRDDEMCFRNVPGCTNSSVAGHRGVKCMSGEPGTYCP